MSISDNHPSVDLTLARAAAAFRDADFFESSILFWSAVLDHSHPASESSEEASLLLTVLVNGLDLEQELGLDVQADEPIELVFPTAVNIAINSDTITPLQTYTLTALCYLARHINVRIDLLPAGQDTLTSLGPPQRYYGSLSLTQKELYHKLLAIVFATASEQSLKDINTHSDQHLQTQQATIMGNEATTTWQTTLIQKRTPYNLPRFFSFLNSNSCTVAGCSIPRNEMDIDALEQAGFQLVITLIKESPLSPTWFIHQGDDKKKEKTPKKIRNAFVPIENRKAPGFPEVFEVLMGWCFRAGVKTEMNKEKNADDYDDTNNEDGGASFQHQRATLIHCGGGKGRAGIVLAAHLIRYGFVGHEMRGYCADCLKKENVHRFDLEQFRKGLGDQESAASTLPDICSSMSYNVDEDEDEDEDDDEDEDNEYTIDGTHFRAVRPRRCLNRFQPVMTAKDAMAHLRELRPGSIESVEQEKAVKAYGDWLWRKSSSKFRRSKRNEVGQEFSTHASEEGTQVEESSSGTTTAEQPKIKKEKKKDPVPKPKPQTPPPFLAEDEDDYSEEEFGRGRKSGKKGGKKGSRKLPQEEARVFVPPPADKIIKVPGSHHQHHLIVQHNMRARQLQRGQKAKKKNGGGGKQSKERPSYHVSGTPLTSAPKLIILAGLPGSGKSHVVTTLLQEFPEHFVRISQDELGSRSVCERLLAQSMRHQQQSLAARGLKKALPMTIFVDRCNPTMAERKEWYEVAFQPDETAMVWFSMNVDRCIERVDGRENHPTVAPGMGSKVVRSFAKSFEFPNLGKEGSWCKTLIEVGDDDGSERLLDVMRKFARDIPSSTSRALSAGGGEPVPIKARPAFIPARVLQRKQNGGIATDGDAPGGQSSLSPKASSAGSMASVEEGEEEEEEDESEFDESEEDEDDELEDDDEESEDDDDDEKDEKDAQSKSHSSTSTSAPSLSSLSITKALQFASPTGYRPAVKKPAKGSWKSNVDQSSMGDSTAEQQASLKGVSFATPLSTYDRPMQKFPRTPHLFDPLTVMQSRKQGSDRLLTECSGSKGSFQLSSTTGRSAAISRSDLLLPPSALQQVFAPKPRQVLTVEEKMDGANIGFSVLHFKTIHGFAGISSVPGPPPKIRVQNRNHFVHPDDHWQFKKLNGWLEKHREDILWLCEGQWRYETRKSQDVADDLKEDADDDDGSVKDDEKSPSTSDTGHEDGDQGWEDEENEDSDGNEYVDEDKVLQDGMAPYVLYGEWLYAKHSVMYTGLRSWFVPFDLFDVKTGTFVSRAMFQKAIAQTQLVPNPTIRIPEDVYGDVDKMLEWTLEKLHSRSVLMRAPKQEGAAVDNDDVDKKEMDRIEGLYFRIDQGDRLLMRSKVVRPDFIAGDERWGTKEQVANQLGYHFGEEYERA
ncbi:hypothetical protein BGX28_007327 [Mortierella sp. GBA30]|nr:hypothetical protein BGX28_007327 [Mortierella sp. GBA30]